LHLSADGLQLLLRLVPVTLLDHLLDLGHLGLCGKGHSVIANRGLLPEQSGPQTVEGIPRARTGHQRTQSTDAQDRGGDRGDRRQPAPWTGSGVPGLRDAVVQCRRRMPLGDRRVRVTPDIVAPSFQNRH
jgi:hypothetical protein